MRQGTHGDDRPCSNNETTQHYATLTSYLVLTEPLDDRVQIGTCPYQNFYAKKYAAELPVIALLTGSLGMHKNHTTS